MFVQEIVFPKRQQKEKKLFLVHNFYWCEIVEVLSKEL